MTDGTTTDGTTVLLPYAAEEVAGDGTLPAGLDVQVWDATGDPPGDDVLARVELYVPPYLVGRRSFELMARMPALRVCQVLTAGTDAVEAYVPAGVALCNARGVHDASTAELAVALALAALRDVPAAVRGQDAGRWQPLPQRPALADRTVLILGYGAIGAAVERRLAGFEVDVLRVARSAREVEAGPVHAMDDLPDLLPRADVVVVVVPLTDATRGLVDAGFLARLRDGALLVNVARGPVVDTAALLAELRGGRLRAALDVTDPEPLPEGHPLWSAPGLLVTPHVGGDTSAFRPRALGLLRAQLTRYAAGEELANVVRS